MKQTFRKVLFIIPSYSHDVIDKYVLPTRVVPFGILSLVSYIEHYCLNIKCEILDFNVKSQDKEVQYAILKSKIIEFKPDIVGLSVMYNACLKHIAPFAEIIKCVDPNVILVAGGILATNMPKEVFSESPLVDAICFGEGEIPLRELLDSKDPNSTFRDHPSWILRDSFEKGKSASQSFVVNLDDIPPINYSLVDGKKYTSQSRNKDGEDGFALPIHSTRGCPFGCIFCCSATNHGKKIRYMSTQRFLSDVERMIREYRITRLCIDDDQFLFNRERAKEILSGLSCFGIELEMANGLTVRFIDDEIAGLLKKAGLKIAVLAIESGSQRVLNEIIGKPLNLDQISPAVAALRKQDIAIHTFFIIGFPGETPKDRQLTREIILNTGFDWNGIHIATPFRGSRLFELCREKGYLPNEGITDLNIYQCRITAPGIDSRTITREAYLLNLDVNFVNNYNLSQGLYKKAAGYFVGIAKRYPKHAFAHYYLACAYERLNGDKALINKHMNIFREIVKGDSKWAEYAIIFHLI